MFKRLTILIFVSLLSITPPVGQKNVEAVMNVETVRNVETVLQSLPTKYSGTYQWVNSQESWSVVVSISDSKALNESDIELNGIERFVNEKTQEVYESKIRVLINIRSLNFVMEEIYSEKEDGFIPMVYRGTMSPDLRDIKAEWVSGDGAIVVMTLRAMVR
ncbi:hypothetical protein [Microcoleus sp. BROC3]|uniref:hypothetical protein n=1 Tax=Microcoleus sp. BROC3 TaxID=3055323 RepID=UPI002FD08ED2